MLLICRQWTRHANIATLYKQFCFPIVFAEGHILIILIVIYNQKLTTWHFWITNLYFAIVCLAWGYHTAAACRVCRHNENNTLYPLCRACLGQCFSYSVPNTFPQSTESLVHCDSCMPAQTQWEVVSCILAHVTGTHQHRLVKLTRKPQVSEMKDGNHCWTRSRSFKKNKNWRILNRYLSQFLRFPMNFKPVFYIPLKFIVPFSQKESSLATTKAL